MDTAEETTPAARPWLALAALTLPVLLISMDNTILGFAVPRLSEALTPSSSELLWIVDVYSFVLAGLLVTMGSLGDRIGRRRLLLAGAAAFSVASLLAAFATSAGTLIAARAVLGLAGATLMPSTLSLIRNIFTDERQRATALAVWAAMFAVGAALGPIVGGILLEHFWWGSVFLVGVPTTALLLVVAPRVVPESRDPAPGPFDLLSSALSMVALVPLVYAVKATAEHGPSAVGAIAVAVGATGAVAFVRRQRRIAHPMIDLTLFRVPRFRMAVSANLVACFGFAGSMFFVTQLLQLVIGLSPARAGLQLIPVVVVSVTCTLAAPVVARRVGAFTVVSGGLAIASVGFVLLSQADGSSLVLPTIAVVILNLGFGAAMAVAIDGILGAIPPERAGAGASVSETAAELGIALGTAVLGSIAAAVYTRSLDLPAGLGEAAAETARDTLGAAELVARDAGPLGPAVRQAAEGAFVDGMVVAALVAAVLTAAVAAWGARIRWTERTAAPPAGAIADERVGTA
jgi:DHA2 family multidrug resistance protein-like MFS transporter